MTQSVMHTYTVQLRISGAELCPEEITARLGLNPNQVRREGELRGARQRWSESMWSYDGSVEGGVKEWGSLEEGLRAVMLKLPRQNGPQEAIH